MNPYGVALEAARGSADFIDLIDTNFHRCGLAPDPAMLAEAFGAYLGGPNRSYSPDPAGSAALRSALTARYPDTTSDQFVVTASASESYEHVFRALLSPGDVILLPNPGYPLFSEVAERCGLLVAHYRLDAAAGWQPDPDVIRELLERAGTRALVLISPNNPTGRALELEIARRILEGCRDEDVLVILDEVFSAFRHPGCPPHLRIQETARGVRSATINGASKLLASPDLKVSWIVQEGMSWEAEIDSLQIESDLFLNGSPINQAVAAHLLEMDGTKSTVTATANRRTAMLRAIDSMSGKGRARISFVEPDSGIHLPLVLDLPAGMDDERVSVDLLRNHHLATHPGYLYGFEQDVIVLSFLAPEKRIAEGVARLDAYLSTL